MIGYIFVFLLISGVGFGLSCWIFGTLLYKSNNLGDSHGDKLDYGVMVRFTSRRDMLSGQEKTSYTASHAKRIDNANSGPKGTELVRRLTPEEIEQYKKAETEAQAASAPAQQVYEPVNSIEAEFRAWEQQQFNNGQ